MSAASQDSNARVRPVKKIRWPRYIGLQCRDRLRRVIRAAFPIPVRRRVFDGIKTATPILEIAPQSIIGRNQ